MWEEELLTDFAAFHSNVVDIAHFLFVLFLGMSRDVDPKHQQNAAMRLFLLHFASASEPDANPSATWRNWSSRGFLSEGTASHRLCMGCLQRTS